MAGQKYILTDENDYVVFTPMIEHSKMARVLRGNVVGAGFCHISSTTDEDGNLCPDVKCYGLSVSLNVESREQDGSIISREMVKWERGF
ncbi:MAG: hypothetical protein DRJ64_07320 [Thermoprotei archaeon]|nr:MAG: hypothetical protein DRJ64_07320 [Thermoprotei archaeon]